MAESNTLVSGLDERTQDVSKVIDDSKRRFRHFLYFFSGQQVSLLGSSVVSFALIWWLTVTTQSELMLGLASLVSLGPFILAAPFSGLLADRFNRKRLLIIVDSIQALITVTLSILFITNHTSIPIIFVVLGLRGTAQAFHVPVSASIAPTMVPQKHLSRINGISYLFSGLVNIIGPVVGAALLAIPGVNIGNVLWIDVITFGIALVPLLFIKIPSVVDKTKGKKQESFILKITDGFSVLKETKGMVALIFGGMLLNFFMSPLTGLLSLFINKIHLGNETNFAIVVGMLQAGIVIGGLLMSIFKGFKKPILFFLGALVIQAFLQIGLTLIPTTINGRFWIMGSILFLYAIPFAVIDVSFITTIQLLIPKEKLG
ncbi:MAG: MFS transporter, partial [Asgard group archaeon]|nr:MFS transporter [Asgard group archaeon]